MSSRQQPNLSALTKQCFAPKDNPLMEFISVVGDIWTILDSIDHNVDISAHSGTADTNTLLLKVRRRDFKNAPFGTLVEKRYDATRTANGLEVTAIAGKLNDFPPDHKTPRQQHDFKSAVKTMKPETLAALLIEDIQVFMDPEAQENLGNHPAFLISSAPIAAALRQAFPPSAKTDTLTPNAP